MLIEIKIDKPNTKSETIDFAVIPISGDFLELEDKRILKVKTRTLKQFKAQAAVAVCECEVVLDSPKKEDSKISNYSYLSKDRCEARLKKFIRHPAFKVKDGIFLEKYQIWRFDCVIGSNEIFYDVPLNEEVNPHQHHPVEKSHPSSQGRPK